MVQRLLMVLPCLIRCSTNSVIHNAVISQDECVPISCRVSSSSYRNGGLGGTESQVGKEREISFVLAAASLAQPKVNALSSARQCVDGAAEICASKVIIAKELSAPGGQPGVAGICTVAMSFSACGRNLFISRGSLG